MTVDLFRLSRRLRSLAAEQQYEERRFLETAAEELFKRAGLAELEQEMLGRLHESLTPRTLEGFTTGLGMKLCRSDIERIIEIIDPQGDYGPEGQKYRDAGNYRIRVGDRIMTQFKPKSEVGRGTNGIAGKAGEVVGLGNEAGEDVIIIRLDGGTRCYELQPGHVLIHQ